MGLGLPKAKLKGNRCGRYGKGPARAALTISARFQLLDQQLLTLLSFLSLVAYLAGIDLLNLTPEGCLLSQCLFAKFHTPDTPFLCGNACKVSTAEGGVKFLG